MSMMNGLDLGTYVSRSRALDLTGIAWDDVPRYPLSPEAVRALRYMQDIETHTIIYLRTLLSTRALDDPEVATFLACWFYEETFHGRVLARFLGAAGHDVVPRVRSKESLPQRIEAGATAGLAPARPDFGAAQQTRGATHQRPTPPGH